MHTSSSSQTFVCYFHMHWRLLGNTGYGQRKYGTVQFALLPTAREGNVFRRVCHFDEGGGIRCHFLSGTHLSRSKPHYEQTLPCKEHGTRQEVTSYPPCYWHLVAANASVGMHPTGMHSCIIVIINTSISHFSAWVHYVLPQNEIPFYSEGGQMESVFGGPTTYSLPDFTQMEKKLHKIS